MGLGGWEWGVILLIVLIFFGAGKLPDVFRQAGKGIKAFKDASEGKDDEAEEDDDEAERRPRKKRRQIDTNDDLDDEPARTKSSSSRKEG
jgi:sec-independent protein translocase protein TatA